MDAHCRVPDTAETSSVRVSLRRRAVYGKLNYISVSGIVRLDASVAPQPIAEGSAKPTFDVWPTPQAKAAASFGVVKRLIGQDYSDDSLGEEEDYSGEEEDYSRLLTTRSTRGTWWASLTRVRDSADWH